MEANYKPLKGDNMLGSLAKASLIGALGVLVSLPFTLTKLESKMYKNSLDGQSKFNTKYGMETENKVTYKIPVFNPVIDYNGRAKCREELSTDSNDKKYQECMDEVYDQSHRTAEVTAYVAPSGGSLIDGISKQDQKALSELEKKFLEIMAVNSTEIVTFKDSVEDLLKSRDEILNKYELGGKWLSSRDSRVDYLLAVRFEYFKK